MANKKTPPDGEDKNGDYWYNGKPYRIIRTGKMRVVEKWQSCIVYENNDCETFVRSTESFNQAFKTNFKP